MSGIDFSPRQREALAACQNFLDDPDRQLFVMTGFAGTGKTTLAKYLAMDIYGMVLFAAYTGKAAHVLQEQGCEGACTLHSLLYMPADKCQQRLRELESELAAMMALAEVDEEACAELEVKIKDERDNLSRPDWNLRLDTPLKQAAVLFIDEMSMVSQQMAEDILAHVDCKVIAMGDPAQLPPVRATGAWQNVQPCVHLDEIHRQAKDSPIITVATTIRKGGTLEPGTYGDNSEVLIIPASECNKEVMRELAFGHEQILCGLNRTRKSYNSRIRALEGRDSPYPLIGDKLVCTKNNPDAGLLNGQLWMVKRDSFIDGNKLWVSLENGTGEDFEGYAHPGFFYGIQPDGFELRDWNCFEYGNAMTVHKAQGSQWDSVLLIDEWRMKFRKEWLYTGATRAAKKLTIVQVVS